MFAFLILAIQNYIWLQQFFFEEEIKDAACKEANMHFEMGRSSYLNCENLIYLRIDGKAVILDETTGKKLVEAFERVGRYLDY